MIQEAAHHKHMLEPLFTEEDIAKRIAAMARDIARSMPADTLIVSLLKGSFVFTADLIRALHHRGMQPQVDFVTLSSYGDNTRSSGNVTVRDELHDDIKGRHILLVDDILESGHTLARARQLVEDQGAASVKIAVLLEKPVKHETDVAADFTGFVVPDKFVVGYGLDYANYYRELPYIAWIESP